MEASTSLHKHVDSLGKCALFPWLQRTGEDWMRLWEQQKSFPEFIPYLEFGQFKQWQEQDNTDLCLGCQFFGWPWHVCLHWPGHAVPTGKTWGRTVYSGMRYSSQREQHRMENFRIFFWRLNTCNEKLQLSVVQCWAVRRVRDKAGRRNTDLFGWKMYIEANMDNREDFLTVVTLSHISHKMQHSVRTLFPQLHWGHKSKFCCFLQLFIHCPHMSWCRTAPCNKVNLIINSKRGQNHTRLQMCFWTIHQHLVQVST